MARKTKTKPATEPAAPEEEAVAPVVEEEAEPVTTDEPAAPEEEGSPEDESKEPEADDDADSERKPGDPVPYGATAIRVYTKDGRETHLRAGRPFGKRPQVIPLESLTPDELETLEYCPVLSVEFLRHD